MVKLYIKGADRCIFTLIHVQTASWYIYNNLQLGEYMYTNLSIHYLLNIQKLIDN